MKIIYGILSLLLMLFLVNDPLAQGSKLKMYGYFDLEFEGSNKDAAGKRWTFDQHHFNVVTVYNVDDHFRVFGEIEWEHGISLESGGQGTGLVTIERGWVEYKHTDGFKIKAGKFLAPFGVYNLKHDATPTYLSTFLPGAIYGKHPNPLGDSQRLYAKFGTGIQVLGNLFADDWEIEYYLYLGNGRGPDPHEKDNNNNKGIGGRLVVNPPVEDLALGVSLYTDKNGNVSNTRQTTIGFDVALNITDFYLVSEFFLPRLEKVDGTGSPNGDFQTSNGFYVEGAYTFSEKFTPFVWYEFFDPDVDVESDGESEVVVGINFAATPRVYLKTEIHFKSFQQKGRESYERYVSSIAVAF